MKKIWMLLITGYTISSMAYAEANLPFIGIRWFNFAGGSGTNMSIQIKANGDTLIKLHGTGSAGIEYKGKYQKIIPVYEDTYYSFSKTHVSEVSKNGYVLKNCNEYGFEGYGDYPCVQELSKSLY